MGTELEGMIRPLVFHCIAGLNNLGILFDGKLASCSNVSREFIEGDLRKERIKTVWENRYIRFRDFEWKRIGECTACDQWDFCHGGPMHKRQGSGEMQECLLWQYRRAACG
jgi:radical SAM protein with 4Fe4S-binding SPASM domain